MLNHAKHLKGLAIQATDGGLGTVNDAYFDDETWVVRYLTVDTGGWLGGREVLISPCAIIRADWPARQLDVKLTKKQVENSPAINTHLPVSRQYEAEYLGYYGYPYYWGGGSTTETPAAIVDRIRSQSLDSHLRSIDAVTGYAIEALDGAIGHVDGFLVDDAAWAIRYIEVATRNWWPGKKVLVSPAWIERVSWMESRVNVGVTREVIQSGPEYMDGMEITREYEDRLHFHYGKPPYWLREGQLVGV
jgi:hypothetical protein